MCLASLVGAVIFQRSVHIVCQASSDPSPTHCLCWLGRWRSAATLPVCSVQMWEAVKASASAQTVLEAVVAVVPHARCVQPRSPVKSTALLLLPADPGYSSRVALKLQARPAGTLPDVLGLLSAAFRVRAEMLCACCAFRCVLVSVLRVCIRGPVAWQLVQQCLHVARVSACPRLCLGAAFAAWLHACCLHRGCGACACCAFSCSRPWSGCFALRPQATI